VGQKEGERGREREREAIERDESTECSGVKCQMLAPATCTCVYSYTPICVYTHTHACTYIHIYMYTYKFTYI